jgi:Cu/Ag efflux protein CusF
MSKKSVSLVAALGMSVLSTAAFAATQSATGAVKSTDAAKHEIVLSDGQTFEVGSKINLGKIKAGDKVTIKFAKKGGKMVASNIKPSK